MKETSVNNQIRHRRLAITFAISLVALGLSGCSTAVDAITNSSAEEAKASAPSENAVPTSVPSVQGEFQIGDFDENAAEYQFFDVCSQYSLEQFAAIGLRPTGDVHRPSSGGHAECTFHFYEGNSRIGTIGLISNEVTKDWVLEKMPPLELPFESQVRNAYFHSPMDFISEDACGVSVTTTGGRIGVMAFSNTRKVTVEQLCLKADKYLNELLESKGIK